VAQKFPYERASTILAEADIFGEDLTAKRWRISPRTIFNYRQKSRVDQKLKESVGTKKKLLTDQWGKDCVKSVKLALRTLDEIIPRATEVLSGDLEAAKAYAAVLHAVAGAVKVVGELSLASEALNLSE
jgi:hypothetical protein